MADINLPKVSVTAKRITPEENAAESGTDTFRDKINTARRAGYSEEDIFNHIKDKDPKIATALNEGYSPDEILAHIAPPTTKMESLARGAGITLRGAAPSVLGATAGAALGAFGGPAAPITVPAGALIGSAAVPISDAVISAYNALAGKNVRPTSEVIKNMLGGPRPETTSERMLEVASSALTPAGIEPFAATLLKGVPVTLGGGMVKLPFKEAPITLKGLNIQPGTASQLNNAPMLSRAGQVMSQAPLSQAITAPTSAAVTQGVTETSDNPLLGAAAGLATGTLTNLRTNARQQASSADELALRAKANYDTLDQSGFQLDPNSFKTHFGSVGPKLRASQGYVANAYPKVKAVIDELVSDTPKDVAEITALRKVIGGVKGSADAQERLIGAQLMDEFDDYVLNAPASAIVGGNKKAIEAWKNARQDYSRMKKSEIFTDIIEKAELSQGDKGKAIASQLSNLSKNDKKMRLFSKEEQEQIKEAAKGGTFKSILKTLSTLAPMTPAAIIFTAISPYGAYTAAGGLASKVATTALQERQANRLANQMRSGAGAKLPIAEGFARNLPMATYRQGVNTLATQQQQNALAQ
jgi:hypothetical protein